MELYIGKKINGENIHVNLEYDVTLNQMISETLPILLSYVKEQKCSYDITSRGVNIYFYDDCDIDRADFDQLQNCLQFIERPLYNFLPQIADVDFPDKMFEKFSHVVNENTESVSVRK